MSSTTRSLTLLSGHTVSGIARCTRSATRSSSSRHAFPWSIRTTLEQVDRLADVLGGTLLAGVGDRRQPGRAGAAEHLAELARRVAALRGIEPHPRDPVAVGETRVEGVEGGRLVEVAEEAHDEPGGEPEPRFGFVEGAADPLDHGRERDPAVGVGLRVEEDLGVAHVVGAGAREVGGGEVVEVLLLEEHARSRVVDVEEVLEVREGIGGPHLLDGAVGQPDPVALRDGEHELGLERALDVQVELGLRKGGHEVRDVRPRGGPAGPVRSLLVHVVSVPPGSRLSQPAGPIRVGFAGPRSPCENRCRIPSPDLAPPAGNRPAVDATRPPF